MTDQTLDATNSGTYKAGTHIGIGAMVIFGLISLALLIGVIFGPADIKPMADSLFPWSLGALAISGIGMLIANSKHKPTADEDEN
ncbi:hypothetical protein [Schaalia vaccimaxillae]|uniref:hypothetical protein n=1 Tax=Schaalia vaccimaxillae TaxID=183916 RepID=UPI0003B774E9|nr:hypothetical protein [Schaalia vaccimaxillae]